MEGGEEATLAPTPHLACLFASRDDVQSSTKPRNLPIFVLSRQRLLETRSKDSKERAHQYVDFASENDVASCEGLFASCGTDGPSLRALSRWRDENGAIEVG
jgi:hypothetical protein